MDSVAAQEADMGHCRPGRLLRRLGEIIMPTVSAGLQLP
jgi:hypothetical protein